MKFDRCQDVKLAEGSVMDKAVKRFVKITMGFILLGGLVSCQQIPSASNQSLDFLPAHAPGSHECSYTPMRRYVVMLEAILQDFTDYLEPFGELDKIENLSGGKFKVYINQFDTQEEITYQMELNKYCEVSIFSRDVAEKTTD